VKEVPVGKRERRDRNEEVIRECGRIDGVQFCEVGCKAEADLAKKCGKNRGIRAGEGEKGGTSSG
jgi:sulfatase maturation enzyme AslB (radical SAM superfamily)